MQENRKQLENILNSDDVIKSIEENLDKLLLIIPEIKSMIGFKHNHPHHHLDVWHHTLLALFLSVKNFEIRLVLLLHDIGKPFCFTDGEVRHFKNHPEVSKNISKKILNRLGYDKDFINEVCYLIGEHDTKITQEEIEKNYNLSYKRYLIQWADALAHNPNKLERRKEYLQDIEKKLNLK